MKLFLCSHFSSVGSLIKEEIENKKVAFIPTASLREGYTGYVGSARKLFKKLGAIVTEIDISTEAYSTIQSVFEEADVIYFTGGNSFFLCFIQSLSVAFYGRWQSHDLGELVQQFLAAVSDHHAFAPVVLH